MKAFFLAAVMVALTFVGLLYWAYSLYVGSSSVSWGTGLPAVPWIPEGINASNISFAKSSWIVAYEFNVSEDGFSKWLKEKAIGPSESFSTPIRILRWYSIKPNRSEAEIENRSIEIGEGFVVHQKNAGGAGVLIIYDIRNHRAYYEWTKQ
jgi:hypothetical protein